MGLLSTLFGVKRRCVKKKRSVRDHRKKCRSKRCSMVSRKRSDLRKKCRRRVVQTPRQAAMKAAKSVAENGGSPKEQAVAAGAAAADQAEANGASPLLAIEAAVSASTEAAIEAGASPEEVSSAVIEAKQNIGIVIDDELSSHPLKDNYDDLNLTGLAFGRRSRFGSCKVCGKSKFRFGATECSVRPNTYDDCTLYMNGSDYPCYSTATGCRKRSDKQPRHQFYLVKQKNSSVNQDLPIPTPPPSYSPPRPSYSPPFTNTGDDFNYHNYTKFCGSIKSKEDCNTRQNCTWNAGNTNRCRARKGTISNPSGEYLEGKEGPELPVMDFGKRRKRVKKSKKSKKVKKIPKAILRKCRKLGIRTTVKRGNKRVRKSLKVLKRSIKLKLKAK
jgi:hypothetical protein